MSDEHLSELMLIDFSRAQREAMSHPLLTPGEYRSLMLRARRWAMICLDAGQAEEAHRQIQEAARFSRMADEIENERRAA